MKNTALAAIVLTFAPLQINHAADECPKECYKGKICMWSQYHCTGIIEQLQPPPADDYRELKIIKGYSGCNNSDVEPLYFCNSRRCDKTLQTQSLSPPKRCIEDEMLGPAPRYETLPVNAILRE
jgi:hypothetical protein